MHSRFQDKNVLVLFSASWGEVDWILPVLDALKLAGATIHAYFLDDSLLEQGSEYADLFADLEAVCHSLCSHQRLLNRAAAAGGGLHNDRELLHDHMQGRCDYILHDYSGIDFSAYYEIFPQARVLVFPHGTFQYAEAQEQLVNLAANRLSYHTIPRSAVLVVGAERDIPYFRTVTQLANIRAVGCPKFDPAWLERKCPPSARKKPQPPLALLLPIPARKTHADSYVRLLTTAVGTLLRHGAAVRIRRHPRQARGEVEQVLAAMPEAAGQDVRIVHHSVLQAACGADFAVSFPSSAVMDCIACDVPVVEFFDYTNQHWVTFSRKKGRLTSIYRSMGLVAPAETEAELDRLVSRLLREPGFKAELLAGQAQAFQPIKGAGSAVNNVLNALGSLE